jgi:hypothetical protein
MIIASEWQETLPSQEYRSCPGIGQYISSRVYDQTAAHSFLPLFWKESFQAEKRIRNKGASPSHALVLNGEENGV